MGEKPISERIRLFLVDDLVLVRESLSSLLATEADFEIAGQCGHSTQALNALKQCPVDVVLLDSNRESDPGADFISSVRRTGYQGKILLVTTDTDAIEALRALEMGASGVFSQHNSTGSLAQAIRVVASGDIWLDRRVIQFLAGQVPRRDDRDFGKTLTEREDEVLRGIIEGLTNRRIADGLGVSEGTVKATLQALFRRFNVRTRSQLVRIAVEGSMGAGKV